MIPGTDLHCFDVYNDGYFFHLPLAYVNGVILEMIVRRMPYETMVAEVLEEKSGRQYFLETFDRLNLYLDHLDMDLSEYLSQAITNEMDACGKDAIEGVEARTNTIDKGKEKVSQDETKVVEAKRITVKSDPEGETFEEHDIYINELLKSLKTDDKDGITKDPFISVEKHVKRYLMYDETTHWRLRKPKYVSVAQFKECLTYYALANGFSLWYERSCEARVVAKCGQRPPMLSDTKKGRQRKRKYEKTVGEHYAMLRSYGKAIVDSNPRSTIWLGVTVNPDDKTYFDRFYVCFAGLADGWEAGCKKIIALDGCFLKSLNQELLVEDLGSSRGNGLTLMSDQHKGLMEARGPVRDKGDGGSRVGASGSRGRGGAGGSRGGASGSRGDASRSRGGASGSRGGVSISRGGAGGFRGGVGRSRGDELEQTQDEPHQTQHEQVQTQDEDQVKQTQEQAEIDLPKVQQTQEQTQDQVQPQEQPQQVTLRRPSARILQRKLKKQGDHHVVEYIDFEGVIYSEFCHIICKLVIVAPVSYFYVKSGVQLNIGDVKEVADFQTKDDSNVEILKFSTDDPWLNKLVGKGKFIGHMDDPIPNLNGKFMIEIDDPEHEVIVSMRYETPAQLKRCSANYEVTHGYQLWYMQNDIHKLQVLCGRDVSEGRCAGKKGKKDTQNDCDSTEGQSSKVKKKNNVSTDEPSKIRVSTSNQDYITPEEHAFMMDQEALAGTLWAEEAEQAAIREIWRQNEENDKAWEAYANEFSEAYFNKDFEDQIEPVDVEASIIAAANKIKGKEPTVQPLTPADAKKKRGKLKKATTEPFLKPSTKADAKKTGGRPKKTTTEPSYGRIYYKNKGRSERIANQNKRFKFDKYGTVS
ncbi:hypothetical protein Tco_0179491 [Tanacetum coccineum]